MRFNPLWVSARASVRWFSLVRTLNEPASNTLVSPTMMMVTAMATISSASVKPATPDCFETRTGRNFRLLIDHCPSYGPIAGEARCDVTTTGIVDHRFGLCGVTWTEINFRVAEPPQSEVLHTVVTTLY